MGKRRRLSGREFRRILERHGFRKVRQRGDHVIMQLQMEGTTVTVPVPDHPELKMGTLGSIIRQRGLPRTEFESGKR